jgi:hypothetical protein
MLHQVLRSRAEPSAGNVYAEWVRGQNETYRQDGLKLLLASFPESECAIDPPIPENSKDANWRIAIDVCLRTKDLESPRKSLKGSLPRVGAGLPSLSPIILSSPTNSPNSTGCWPRSMRIFLSEAIGREVTLGKIMHGDGHRHAQGQDFCLGK